MGVIESYNYPNQYPNNMICLYTITVPDNGIILLNFTQMDVELAPNCTFDAITVSEKAPLIYIVHFTLQKDE